MLPIGVWSKHTIISPRTGQWGRGNSYPLISSKRVPSAVYSHPAHFTASLGQVIQEGSNIKPAPHPEGSHPCKVSILSSNNHCVPCTQVWVLTHSLFVPVVDLVDIPEDYLVLALHTLGDATGLHGRHVALQKSKRVDYRRQAASSLSPLRRQQGNGLGRELRELLAVLEFRLGN